MTQRQERHRDRGTQRKRFFLCVPLLLLLLGCASVRPVIKIGLVAPFEGRDRAIGYDAVYAARLAVRQANAAGGIGGYRVSLVALDDGGNATLAGQTAAALVVDSQVVAVVGHYLPETTAAAAEVYANAGLPLLPAGAAHPHQLGVHIGDRAIAVVLEAGRGQRRLAVVAGLLRASTWPRRPSGQHRPAQRRATGTGR